MPAPLLDALSGAAQAVTPQVQGQITLEQWRKDEAQRNIEREMQKKQFDLNQRMGEQNLSNAQFEGQRERTEYQQGIDADNAYAKLSRKALIDLFKTDGYDFTDEINSASPATLKRFIPPDKLAETLGSLADMKSQGATTDDILGAMIANDPTIQADPLMKGLTSEKLAKMTLPEKKSWVAYGMDKINKETEFSQKKELEKERGTNEAQVARITAQGKIDVKQTAPGGPPKDSDLAKMAFNAAMKVIGQPQFTMYAPAISKALSGVMSKAIVNGKLNENTVSTALSKYEPIAPGITKLILKEMKAVLATQGAAAPSSPTSAIDEVAQTFGFDSMP